MQQIATRRLASFRWCLDSVATEPEVPAAVWANLYLVDAELATLLGDLPQLGFVQHTLAATTQSRPEHVADHVQFTGFADRAELISASCNVFCDPQQFGMSVADIVG